MPKHYKKKRKPAASITTGKIDVTAKDMVVLTDDMDDLDVYELRKSKGVHKTDWKTQKERTPKQVKALDKRLVERKAKREAAEMALRKSRMDRK